MIRTRIKTLFFSLVIMAVAAICLDDTFAQKGSDDFSHSTSAHKKINCGSCHKIPTANWTAARGFPDIADYPDHASCVQCHRNEFFRGNRPTICAVCHVAVGPRSRERFEFPVKNRSEEFETIFPHDVHQNIIASVEKKYDIAVAHFVNATFRKIADDDKPQFNNCAICHPTATVLPEFKAIIPLKTESLSTPDAEIFTPKAEYFKDMPEGHASCFNCHYQGLKPTRTDCASCHRLTAPYVDSDVLQRISLKYNHSSDTHVKKDCTYCHVRITQTSDLRNMVNADVPLLTCSGSSCHGGDASDKRNLKFEILKRNDSKTEGGKVFQCTYCHTPAVGSFEIPPSHLEQ